MEIRNLQKKVKLDRQLVEKAARSALSVMRLDDKTVSCALVGDRAMSRLNRRYTGRKGPTDVLAFSLEDEEYLGEVIVSVDACLRQARERGLSFEHELSLLVVHGTLHLAGCDHTGKPEDKRLMEGLERKAMKKLGAEE